MKVENPTDTVICEALEGSGAELGKIIFYCVRRRGHLLLALPADRDTASATLKLYQPQVVIGKVVATFVRLLICTGLQRLLPKKSLTVRASGPLADLLHDESDVGFLLGNPEANTRRALLVHQRDGGYVVDKVGVDKKSRQSVMAELRVIKMLPDGLEGVPVLYGNHVEDTWASYTTVFCEGISPKKSDDERVIGILSDWMKDGRSVSLSELGLWQKLHDYASINEVGEVWATLGKDPLPVIKSGVFHGDFAPWNIKLTSEGKAVVLDWETGINEAPVGWDWLHYMIQRSLLVSKKTPCAALNECRAWAATEIGLRFLHDAGWSGHEECWIGSYLAYSSWVGGFDRTELLSEWIDK